ncbi:MAG TPA: glycosyltransferase family 4 protein [Cytophagales bacterium]|nr:glycosyltransferase family 4 protein [Cytophagales bacterium]
MLKIAILLNTSWNIYNFRLSLLKALQAEGHKIICIAPKDEYSERLIKEGFDLIEIPLSPKAKNPLLDLKFLYYVHRVLCTHMPDYLLTFTIKPNVYGTIAARLCKIKTINNVSGLGTVFLREGISSTLAKYLYKTAFQYSHHVFFQNHDDRKLFVGSKLVNPAITDVLPGSGVDLCRFSPIPPDAPLSSETTFLMPARLLVDKGVYEYVAAAEKIKATYGNAKFLLVGKPDFDSNLGVRRADLKAWIHKGIIEYHGFIDHMTEFYRTADCVVLPSYREGTSRALLEALAMAKPIITTDTPGCRETVNHGGNGYLCKVKDVDTLVTAMSTFLALERTQRLDMGKLSREKAEAEFDEKFVINKYKKVIFEF